MLCHHLLGQGLSAAQAIPYTDNALFPPGQRPINKAVQLLAFHLDIQVIDDGIVHHHGAHQRQGVPGLICFNGLVDGNALGRLFPAAKEHQNFIFDTPESIAA